MATVLTTTDVNNRAEDRANGFPVVSLDVRFAKRSQGGWNVARADNGRVLGWLVKDGPLNDDGKPCWEACVAGSAFRGDGPDDLGNPLDDVPARLFCGSAVPPVCHAIGFGRTRQEAASAVYRWLHGKRAPAVGFGRHPAVQRHADR